METFFGKTKEESPIQNAINNWDKKEMDLLLCLKEKESFLVTLDLEILVLQNFF